MDRNEALGILWDTARNNTRHKNYKRTVDLADKYYRFVTGDGLEKDMIRFVQRENATMFQQRKDITKHIIPTVVKNLMDVQYKVPRSNSLTRKVEYESDKAGKRAEKFEEILGKFWGDKSFDDYMGVRSIELNNTDPNTFVITEFKDFDPTEEHLQPYPFESSAKMSVNFEVDNNVIQWLIVRQETTFEKGEKEVKGARHTMYLPERAYVLEELYDQEIVSQMPEEDRWYQVGKVYYIRFEERLFRLVEPEPYNLKRVPARRIGYKRDLETNGETFVSPFHDTIPILEKTIKANSELDLTMALHAFPQKIMMGKRCDNPECLNGYINETDKDGNEHKSCCPQCEGVGLIPCTTTQDVLLLEPSEAREEQLSIDDLVRYVAPTVDLITFQEKYVEKLTWKAKQTMFNSDIFTREEVAETATGKNIDLQNVYDTLWPFAVKYADTWEFFVGTVAELTDMQKGLVFSFTFDKDFKMKTTSELYNDLQKANESGADAFAIQDIQLDIARNIFANNPDDFHKYVVKQGFYPFSGKTKEEIIAIKAGNNTSRFYKVLEENYSNIFDAIEMAYGDFYLMDRKKQWEIIKETTNDLIKEIGESETQDLGKKFGE